MTKINGIEYPDELLEWLQPGNVLRGNLVYGYPKKVVYHILEIVEEDQAVLKWWSKYKQRWIYRVEWFYKLKLAYKDGNLEFVKKEEVWK